MKKRKMVKYIPKNTLNCDGCRFYINKGEMLLTRDKGCKYAVSCQSECESLDKVPCTYCHCGCTYLNVFDREGETSLIDGIKICGISTGL